MTTMKLTDEDRDRCHAEILEKIKELKIKVGFDSEAWGYGSDWRAWETYENSTDFYRLLHAIEAMQRGQTKDIFDFSEASAAYDCALLVNDPLRERLAREKLQGALDDVLREKSMRRSVELLLIYKLQQLYPHVFVAFDFSDANVREVNKQNRCARELTKIINRARHNGDQDTIARCMSGYRNVLGCYENLKVKCQLPEKQE